MNNEQVLDLADYAARCYCEKYGAWLDFDDAKQEAAVFILTHTERLEQLPRNKRRNITVLALVRWHQNKHNLRLKTPPKFRRLQDVVKQNVDLQNVDFWEEVEAAIVQSNNELFADVIRAYVITGNIKSAARRCKISERIARRIRVEFLTAYREIKKRQEK